MFRLDPLATHYVVLSGSKVRIEYETMSNFYLKVGLHDTKNLPLTHIKDGLDMPCHEATPGATHAKVMELPMISNVTILIVLYLVRSKE